MVEPVLYDAVTLRHFAQIGRLDILKAVHGHLLGPRWTQAVCDEINEAAAAGFPGCSEILATSWLGDPVEPEPQELKPILGLQIGLNAGHRPPTKHAGEAESIYFTGKLGGTFITDDNEAHDFGTRHLGMRRVRDTIDLLREAVASGDLMQGEARNTADAIRNCGRYLRRLHPPTLLPGYFS